MKFTPETLLQIYLDGAFTDEAQAEFDALMRRDPSFTEKVTQALTQRLGPVPEELVNGISAKLDAKIDGTWNQHKPAPALRYLKWGAQTALILGAAGGLFFGGRLLVAKLTSPPSSGVAASTPSSLPGIPATAENAAGSFSEAKGENSLVPVSRSETSAFTTDQAIVPAQTSEDFPKGEKPGSASSHPPNHVQGGLALQPVSIGGQNSLRSIPSSVGSTSPAGAGTSEGNSLRVAIDLDKAEKVDVTVLDSDGLLIRHLYNGVVPAGEHYVDWDGKDGLGNVVLPGDYTVILDRDGKKMSGILKVLPNR